MRSVALLLILSLMGCGGTFSAVDSPQVPADLGDQDSPIPNEPGPTPAPELKPEPARWEAVAAGSRAWTEFVYEQLDVYGPALLDKTPSDIEQFCPAYKTLSRSIRKNFWVYLLSSITQFESNFNPAVQYTEDFTDSTGARVVSRGLLQLSIESARAYGCDLPSALDLHDPEKNLLCGLRILNRWVGEDGLIRGTTSAGSWRGGARYWSVLRRDAQYNSIRTWTAEQAYCN